MSGRPPHNRDRSNSKNRRQLPPMPKNPLEKMSIEDILRQAAQIEKESLPPPVQNPVENVGGGRSGSKSRQSPNYANSGNSSDLTTSLLKRVTALERALESHKRELREKFKENIELKDRVEALEKCGNPEEALKVYEENKELKKELEAIKGFLKDYGLVWKGSKTESEGEFKKEALDKVLDAKKPRYNFNLPKEIDISLIMHRVNELNFVVQKEGNHKETKKNPHSGAHQLMEVTPKVIAFYKNGVHLEGFPVFYYGSHDALALMADLLDGYFPRQLEKSYPDGTLLKVIDRLDEMHGEKTKNTGKDSKSPLTIGEMADDQLRPVPLATFLNDLPNKAIKDGKIVEIRQGVKDLINGPKSTQAVSNLRGVIKNPVGDWIIQNKYVLEPEFVEIKENGTEITVLKIRLDFLDSSLILYTLKKTTIEEVLSIILKCLVDKKRQYKLQNGFPRSGFEGKEKKSLEELGLHPRAALYLSELPSKTKS